jgi:hypothetical protein
VLAAGVVTVMVGAIILQALDASLGVRLRDYVLGCVVFLLVCIPIVGFSRRPRRVIPPPLRDAPISS